jgi:hypothetical protein
MSEQGKELNVLKSMLSFRRPAGSPTERNFISMWIKPLGVEQDSMGNLYKRIGTAPVLWSCHTDTVSKKGGMQGINHIDGYLWTNDKGSNCLGADDTAGVWLCREMIKAQRPGLYVFHRQEECGGCGSQHIADKTPELLNGIEMAVAFDRRGRTSVITHQFGGRCCSDAFGDSLARELDMGHSLDKGGSFTDTANYADLIPECSNLSIGYTNEHSIHEWLDSDYLLELRERMLELDVSKLSVERDPDAIDPADAFRKEDVWELEWQSNTNRYETYHKSYPTMFGIVRDNPDVIADLLEEHGMSVDELANEVLKRGGLV